MDNKFKYDVFVSEAHFLRWSVVGNDTVHGVFDRSCVNFAVRNVAFAGALDGGHALDGEGEVGAGADDAGAADVGGGGDGGGLMHPDRGCDLGIVVAKAGADGQDQLLDALQCLPGIFKFSQIATGQGMIQIIKLLRCEHKVFLP